MRGGFSQWFFGREPSRCAPIFTNAQYSQVLQLPALLISQEVAFNLEAAAGVTRAISPRSRSGSAKVPRLPIRALIQRAKQPSRWQRARALSNTQLPGFTLPHKVDGVCNHMGKAGAELKLPQPPACLVTALNEHFPNPTQLCNKSFSYSCEVALKDHKTPTSKTLDECFTSWIPGCQPRYLRERRLAITSILLLLVGILFLWSFFLLVILWI